MSSKNLRLFSAVFGAGITRTTPPCSEGVRWLVMKQPVQVSQAQIDAFKAAMHHPNNRPVQPLHGRLVLQ